MSQPGEERAARFGVSLADLAAVALLAGGVGVGVASFLPPYLAGASLASQSMTVIAHALPLAGWTLVALLVVFGARSSSPRLPAGFAGAVGVGVATVELGLVLADIGTAVAGSSAGPGLVLTVIEWALCSAGSVVALYSSLRRAPSATGKARPEPLAAAGLLLVGLGTAALFAPPWDRYVVVLSNVGRVTVVTAGNAFAEPAAVVAGNVVVMVAIALVAVTAAFARRIRLGAALLGGAVIVLAGQIASAVAQWRSPVPASEFGLSPARAASLGFHVDAGFTAAFYGFCACVAILAGLAAGRARSRAASTLRPADADPSGWPGPSWPTPEGTAGWAPPSPPSPAGWAPPSPPGEPPPPPPASWAPPPPASWAPPSPPAGWAPPEGPPVPVAPPASSTPVRPASAPRRPTHPTPHY